MSKNVTKRCHWVSQSYLKAFAVEGNGPRVWRHSREEGDPELKLIEKVAVRFHLYSPTGADGKRDDSMEKKLADLEKFFGDPVWKAVCTDFPDFSWEPLRKMVALLAAVTWLRTPRQLELWTNIHRQLANFITSSGSLPDVIQLNDKRINFDHSLYPAYQDATDEDIKRDWNQWIGQSAGVAKMFMNMRWAILTSEQPVFITSDNPVLVGDTLTPHRGLKHPETIVTFPLSPTRVLIMDNRHSEPDAQFYPLKHSPACTNALIWRNSIEYMFSSRHPDEVCTEILVDAEQRGF